MATYRGDYYFLDYLDEKKYMQYFSSNDKYWFKKYQPFLPAQMQYLLHKIKNFTRINESDVHQTSKIIPFPLINRLNRGDEAWCDPNFRERFKSYRHYQKYRLLKAQVPLRMESETHFGTWFRQEARFPMADIRLTQFYLSLPNPLKYEGPLTRTAWRKSMHGYLPEAIMKRDSKSGIMIPYNSVPTNLERHVQVLAELLANSNLSTSVQSEIKALSKGNVKANKHIALLHWLKNNATKL
jgi:asparagine synthase (glutamine-hydrolysing)